MRLARTTVLLALAFCWLAIASTAQAGIVYSYTTGVAYNAAQNAGQQQTSYTATGAGAPVTVYVYLNEALTGSSTSLISANQTTSSNNAFLGYTSATGLAGAGFSVLQTTVSGGTGTTIASIGGNGNSADAGHLDDGFGSGNGNTGATITPSSTPTSAKLLEGINNSEAGVAIGPTGTTSPNSQTSVTGMIYLGSVTLTAGGAGSTTMFSLQPYNGSSTSGETVANDLDDFDTANGTSTLPGSPTYTGADAGPFETFTVMVPSAGVPEPGSLVLTGLALLGGLGRMGFRRLRGRGVAANMPEAAVVKSLHGAG